MRNIYIDGGCYDADTVKQFRNWGKIIAPGEDWYIFGFDPNPRFKDNIWKKNTTDNIKFFDQAIWVEDTELDFTLRPEDAPYGSTVMKEKVDWGMGEIIKVKAFDFAVFLRQFKNDFVIVKLDLEGAELPVLTHIIKQGADRYIDYLLVEWHDGKMPQYKSNKHWILDNLKCEYFEWR